MAVGQDIVGRPVNAVLAPPQAERFVAVADVDPNRLALNVTGWNKLVLLDCDRVFLFPRSATGVKWFERELAAYQALAKTQLGIVPRLLGCWEDPDIYPFPFAAATRLWPCSPVITDTVPDSTPKPIEIQTSRSAVVICPARAWPGVDGWLPGMETLVPPGQGIIRERRLRC